MSDEIAPDAPPITSAPGFAMPTPTQRKHPPKRNAKPRPKHKHAPKRYRNAGPPAPRVSALRRPVVAPPQGLSMTEKLVQLGETFLGAAAASVAGAYAVKWGFHPELVSYGLGAAGVFSATRKRELVRLMGTGAASAAGSQLVLLKLNPQPAAPPVVAQPQPQPQPTHIAQFPKPKNADLGSLPPGVLDAAFERARAELAVSGDGYPPNYEYPPHAPHHVHHGPVFPSG